MAKYHVALSFAGEDRTYVERVATLSRAANVRARKLEPLQTAANTYFPRFSTNQSKYPVC